ncbi:D-alanine--D-alanine ligase [Vagococcus zengguangii]|uniref:D-alanine--D-alanine ligase n=1 Tax=Vagococcus zengguangii TaxID=2571750 RepID=A0A4D7CXI3_9ENTE|nr:D-alanine--D-alanine ligase [Vagococcus zengguangii]QCI86710.1 D-alanine--D-alanine ligase [Vagococcus zengguangii]
MKIIALYGGKSAEHDISILSTFSMLQAFYYDYYQVQLVHITKEGKWFRGPLLTQAPEAIETLHLNNETFEEIKIGDIVEENAVVFPILHGPNGEDGTIQGMLETLNMPYVGTGVLSSACGMDKIMTKHILQQIGIPQVPYVALSKVEWLADQEKVFEKCEGSLIYPMFVKPANLGSSVGISKADTKEELQAAIETALKYDRRIVVEQGIDAREIEIGVLGNDEVRTTLAGEIVKDVAFYDYESKYIDNQVTLQIPAEIPAEIHEQAREYAKNAYIALDGSGLSRCDFFLTSNNELYLNELNTMPGFTQFSMYPLLWQEMGLKYGDLIEELIQLALNRHKEKQALANE